MPGAAALAGENVSVRFFMYTDHALDHNWFRKCPAFQQLRSSSENDNLAEVGMRHALLHSTLRVHSPDLAQLFFVPIFEFASHRIGECENTTHQTRMESAYQTLIASPYWKRYHGKDHMFASSAWNFVPFTMVSLLARSLHVSLQPFMHALSVPTSSRVRPSHAGFLLRPLCRVTSRPAGWHDSPTHCVIASSVGTRVDHCFQDPAWEHASSLFRGKRIRLRCMPTLHHPVQSRSARCLRTLRAPSMSAAQDNTSVVPSAHLQRRASA